ncbi:PBECR4 domain-containing protein [uncultured Streptococcus sp.]|uniref:PBECR4 domain-containing protein n=1 Tax=uncultured Streptococcus sp. TaxID=83427 RepID=UPI002677042B|nr:PBECR4 domain-containing protein [uncultured Streptococcus sp.]
MAEEHKQQSSSSRKSRRERVEYARSRDILDVANEMNMELVRSGRDYRWKEHDSMVISPDKNMWNWFSRHQGGDVISLVETMKEVNFNQAIDHLNDGSFKEYTSVERVQEPFFYYLEPYEQPFEAARTYLKEQRGLSDETIDFFLEKGVLTQANAKVNGSIEPVVVFKSFDFAGEIVGATLQGIEENWEKWPERGYAKNIVRNSDGITGLHVDIGQPNRLIFAESAIDLMSYYELHKDSLQDVRLVSMDGLKEAIVGRHLTQLQEEIKGRPLRWTHDQLAEGLQTAIDNNFFTDGKHADWITLAVDNDEGGRNFIDSLREKGATINEDLPDLQSGQDKTDWNDVLKQHSNLELSDNNKEPDQTRNEEQDVLFENLANMTSSPTPETYEMILQQLRNETVIIAPEVVEEVAEEKTLMSEKADFSAEKTEKPLEVHQGQDVSEQQKNERMYQRKGYLQPEAEGSTSPVLETSTFERSVTSRPTVSSQYLNFSIKDGFKSRKTKYEKSIDAYNLGKLNRRGVDIQEAAQFYLNELANSTVHYFTSDGSLVQVNFLEENFLHLTGLKIIGDAATPEKVLHDFANGGELSYDDIRLKNTESPFDKIKVLPDLETVLQTDSFYFDDLQDIPRYQGRFDSLIKSDDSDLMLLFRMNTEDGIVPVSVFKARQVLKVELQEARKNEILGIFRERGGLIEQIDINKNYVKDDGEEMLSILKNKQYEESRDIDDRSMNVSSYSFNHQDYSDIDSLLAAGSAYVQTTECQEWLAIDPEYHQELLDIFESATATPKQKLEVMSEFGNIQVNGYDIVAGFSEALSDDALFLDQNVITEENGSGQEESIPMEIDQPISQQQLESLRNYFARQMDKVETRIGRSEAGVFYRSYRLRNSYGNEMEIADTNLGNELSSEEQLASLMDRIVENYGKPFWDVVQHPDFELSDEEASQLAYPTVTLESLSEVFVSAELFTKVLDSAYNVGDSRKLGLQVPEESKGAWERYYELSDIHEGNFSAVVDAADELGLVDKNSNFYQEWKQDHIYKENYHVRLQWAETWPDGPQIPFKETELVDYQTFAETLYKENKAFYERHHGSVAEVNATGNQEAYIPFTKVKFDVYAPGGTLIKSDVRYDIGDETEPISRLLGLGYRRLGGQPELAAIDEMVLSQLENQEVNQNIAAEANEQAVASQEIPESISSEDFQSPKQGIRTGLAQRVEEIMAEDATKILVASIPQVQENLSVEGDLIGTPQADGQMLYTNQENFGRDYRLELAVHSPVKIDKLSDIQAPWTLELIHEDQKLGYLAYGGDWGNDFQVKKELEKLASQIGTGNSPEGLYKQEEIDAFLTNNGGQEPSQRIQENISSAEPFDYKSASAYEISERAFQKIREYTQSPEDLMEYVEFMSKFPQLSPRNVALIQEQWRGANAVATYDQWQSMGEALGIKPEDVIQTKATYVNKRTGETKEVVHRGLSVKTGEKSQITLFRPLMVRMIPVIDENGNHVKNDKGNPKYKKFSDATPQEKELVKAGKLPVRQFQERNPKTGQPRFTTYKVFELSQTTLKPESYPKAMPNRHYNFDVDKVKTKEVLEGLCDYAESIGVSIMKDEAHVLGNTKGAFFPQEQLILINPDNTPGEKIATTIHELAHATLHNPSLSDQYKELPKVQKELEAEMTSHLLSKHFGLDTSEKAIDYMAKWTDNLQGLDDKQLADSLKRIHKTVSKMHKQIEHHTKPYQLGKSQGQTPNFPKAPTKGPSR